MRSTLLAFWLLAPACLAPVLNACCLSFAPSGLEFFNRSTAVAYARWDGQGSFIVESGVRGDWKPNDKVAHEQGRCEVLEPANLYLISRNCNKDGCRIASAGERDLPRLIDYLRNEHDETHGSIRAEAVAWLNGSLSLPDFRKWLKYAGVKPSNQTEDDFAQSLIVEFERLGFEISWIPQGKTIQPQLLEDIERLARDFPDAHPEDFDARFTDDDDDSPRWAVYERNLDAAISKARNAAGPLMPKWH
jgi:hypothetical protein